MENVGLRAQRSKCQFGVHSVSFLGHRIDGEGVHPLPDKVNAIKKVPTPQKVRQLKSYLGLLSYYSKYLPDLSSVLAPLYQLLCKNTKWRWSEVESKAFEHSKNLLTSETLLVHWNPSLPLVLSCDASEVGIGAVLAHRYPDGSERPIAYTSRSLSKSEKNYAQLEKEGLSCVFGIKKFHMYLIGHHFKLYTDHKPLLALLLDLPLHKLLLAFADGRYSCLHMNTTWSSEILSHMPMLMLSADSPYLCVLQKESNHLRSYYSWITYQIHL